MFLDKEQSKAFNHDLLEVVKNFNASKTNGLIYSNIAKVLIVQVLFLFCLYSGLTASHWASFLLYFSGAGILFGFNGTLLHEAVHGCLSGSKTFDKYVMMFINMCGFYTPYYQFKHNIHHSYTNLDGVDDDIELMPFIRLLPEQPKSPLHRFQHVYALPLYLFTGFYLVFDFAPFSGITKVGRTFKVKGIQEQFVFWFGKVLHLLFFLVLPVSMFGWIAGLVGFALVNMFSGFYLAMCIQPTHIFTDTAFPKDYEEKHLWFQKIIATTMSYSANSRAANFLTTGLNDHVTHSLFPKISHVYFRELYPQLVRVFDQYGVRFHEFRDYRECLGKHVEFMRKLGR